MPSPPRDSASETPALSELEVEPPCFSGVLRDAAKWSKTPRGFDEIEWAEHIKEVRQFDDLPDDTLNDKLSEILTEFVLDEEIIPLQSMLDTLRDGLNEIEGSIIERTVEKKEVKVLRLQALDLLMLNALILPSLRNLLKFYDNDGEEARTITIKPATGA